MPKRNKIFAVLTDTLGHIASQEFESWLLPTSIDPSYNYHFDLDPGYVGILLIL